MVNVIAIFVLILVALVFVSAIRASRKRRAQIEEKVNQSFPAGWRKTLEGLVLFYANLDDADKDLFEKRVQVFIAEKDIKGIDTDIDDAIKLMVAASAIIPTFAFPAYNYPNVSTILIYPNSFDEQFQTERFEGQREFITGIVGSRSLNGTVILSKPDLVAAFDGLPHKENVGIHEFVHLLDKEDGAINGVPEVLISNAFVGPWLIEIKKEMKRIEAGASDINPYALRSNAEFLAVVSEYFFDNPEKFKRRHAELYGFLTTIFNREKRIEPRREEGELATQEQ